MTHVDATTIPKHESTLEIRRRIYPVLKSVTVCMPGLLQEISRHASRFATASRPCMCKTVPMDALAGVPRRAKTTRLYTDNVFNSRLLKQKANKIPFRKNGLLCICIYINNTYF